MKDILIKGYHAEREIKYFIACFIAAIALHVYAIVTYQTRWIELLTQIHVTLALTIVFYLIVLLIRFIGFAVNRIFLKSKTE